MVPVIQYAVIQVEQLVASEHGFHIAVGSPSSCAAGRVELGARSAGGAVRRPLSLKVAPQWSRGYERPLGS